MLEKLFKVAVVVLALYAIMMMNIVPMDKVKEKAKSSWQGLKKIWVNKN